MLSTAVPSLMVLHYERSVADFGSVLQLGFYAKSFFIRSHLLNYKVRLGIARKLGLCIDLLGQELSLRQDV